MNRNLIVWVGIFLVLSTVVWAPPPPPPPTPGGFSQSQDDAVSIKVESSSHEVVNLELISSLESRIERIEQRTQAASNPLIISLSLNVFFLIIIFVLLYKIRSNKPKGISKPRSYYYNQR